MGPSDADGLQAHRGWASLSENTDAEYIQTREMTTLSAVLELGNGDSKAGARGKVNIAVTEESRSVRFCFTLCQPQLAICAGCTCLELASDVWASISLCPIPHSFSVVYSKASPHPSIQVGAAPSLPSSRTAAPLTHGALIRSSALFSHLHPFQIPTT